MGPKVSSDIIRSSLCHVTLSLRKAFILKKGSSVALTREADCKKFGSKKIQFQHQDLNLPSSDSRLFIRHSLPYRVSSI